MLKILKNNYILLFVLIVWCIVSCDTSELNYVQTDKYPKKKVLSPEHLEIFNILKDKDSLLFELGFNKIDTTQVKELISEDFEFYHDEHGVTNSKSTFVHSINGIQDLPFKTRRELIKESLEIFPLYKNNNSDLYGAIQMGEHNFYQQKPGKKEIN